ncbi:MAG TPA: sugar ABC transporter permease [Candidatus Acidoferrum sp.]|nr:sugar ABC transporter permease [Candidatus Acidoferrum sp.]
MILPAAITLALIIAFPLLYSLWMAVHEYSMGATTPPKYVGAANYVSLLWNQRFQEAVPRTFHFTLLGVAGPVLIGTVAALAFSRSFPGRGVLRTIFTLPMMATPVSIALIWQMMFHPQLGVLNYLLSLIRVPPQKWVFASQSVIPTLALVETWQWTPFVMLIVLGGIASLPEEPFEAARIDGASFLQSVFYITLPLLWPYIMIAIILRAIDALKSFDIIYVITQGGPGTASETLNIFLYLQAFAFYNVGFASAVVVVFFLLILGMSVGLLLIRRRTSWQ